MFIRKALLLLTLVLGLLATGCTARKEELQLPANSDIVQPSVLATPSSVENVSTTTIMDESTTTTTKTTLKLTTKRPSTTSKAVTTKTTLKPTTKRPSTTSKVITTKTTLKPTTKRLSTTSKVTTTKTTLKSTTATTKYFSYLMPYEEWEEIHVETFTFDYESEDYQPYYDLVAKYCDDPDLGEYQVSKVSFVHDNDPQTGEFCVMSFYLDLDRHINGCDTENTYSLLLEKKDGVYQADTLRRWISDYDPNKVKAPRKPTKEEEEAALKSEKERVQKEIDRMWPDSNYIVSKQEVVYKYNIEHDYNYFIVKTKYTRGGIPDGVGGAMAAEFEIER